MFLHLQGGVTREPVPRPEDSQKQLNDLRRKIKSFRVSSKRNARKLERKSRKLRKQFETLNEERKRGQEQRREIRKQRIEIFQLNNELSALDELVESGRDMAAEDQTSGKPDEVGTLPDFVVIGAPRCGTSVFYGLLTRHPNVEGAATKEVHYFDRLERFEKGVDWYKRCFPRPQDAGGRKSVTGEATPRYLASPAVPERMARVIPEACLISLLRNPVDRAYSRYNQQVRRGSTLSFEEAVEAEQEWLSAGKSITLKAEQYLGTSAGPRTDLLSTGIYVDHLLRWREFFNEEQMLILKSEDFYKYTTEVMDRVQDFLSLPHQELDLQKHKTSYSYEPMNPETRRQLEDFFEPHNQRLYEYLGVDLGW